MLAHFPATILEQPLLDVVRPFRSEPPPPSPPVQEPPTKLALAAEKRAIEAAEAAAAEAAAAAAAKAAEAAIDARLEQALGREGKLPLDEARAHLEECLGDDDECEVPQELQSA